MSAKALIEELRGMGDPKAAKGMARFGISGTKTLGVSIPRLRDLAKRIGKNHGLAGKLWDSGYHEARILAAMVDDPSSVTGEQMDSWARDFDSWDVCDQCCGVLFDKTPFAYDKALEWSAKEQEFVKRAGFVMMAELAVHDKDAPDEMFLSFFDALERGSADPRNFVKKAVNWAIRQIGKRDARLNREAIRLARQIHQKDIAGARWVASDAIRELSSASVRTRLRRSSSVRASREDKCRRYS